MQQYRWRIQFSILFENSPCLLLISHQGTTHCTGPPVTSGLSHCMKNSLLSTSVNDLFSMLTYKYQEVSKTQVQVFIGQSSICYLLNIPSYLQIFCPNMLILSVVLLYMLPGDSPFFKGIGPQVSG